MSATRARRDEEPADQEFTRIAARVGRLRNEYHRRARGQRIWFRASGVAIIVLSATLPFLANLDFGHKDFILGLIGVMIAVLVGLRSFYDWDRNWSMLRRSDFELTNLLNQWELDVASAPEQPPERVRALHRLTHTLLSDAEEIRRAESEDYFSRLRPPDPGGSGGNR